jgi:hypothetical protein
MFRMRAKAVCISSQVNQYCLRFEIIAQALGKDEVGSADLVLFEVCGFSGRNMGSR